MKSPFPGMDPYLEQFWRDVHHRLCTYSCDALQPQLRPGLLARIEERLVVESDNGERSISPDVRVFQTRSGRHAPGAESSVGIAEPLQITQTSEPMYEGFIQILDPAAGGTLVTVIEFLAISNKKSKDGTELYREKMNEAIKAGVSVVEIDLLRGGAWVLQVAERRIPLEKRSPYRACVRRGWNPDLCSYYHFPITERLLKLPIPLRENDKDALLDLQEVVDEVYQKGAYDDTNYDLSPSPEFDAPTAQWARELIAKRGR